MNSQSEQEGSANGANIAQIGSISAENLNQETSCYLFDSFGNLLFNGPDLSAHDFSQLHPGLYFLSIPVLNMHVPLVKE